MASTRPAGDFDDKAVLGTSVERCRIKTALMEYTVLDLAREHRDAMIGWSHADDEIGFIVGRWRYGGVQQAA
jgi:hypothetical protein